MQQLKRFIQVLKEHTSLYKKIPEYVIIFQFLLELSITPEKYSWPPNRVVPRMFFDELDSLLNSLGRNEAFLACDEHSESLTPVDVEPIQ